MTFQMMPVTLVVCDSRKHTGASFYRVEFGPGVSAAEALRSQGWHQSAAKLTHTCPDCAKRIGQEN